MTIPIKVDYNKIFYGIPPTPSFGGLSILVALLIIKNKIKYFYKDTIQALLKNKEKILGHLEVEVIEELIEWVFGITYTDLGGLFIDSFVGGFIEFCAAYELLVKKAAMEEFLRESIKKQGNSVILTINNGQPANEELLRNFCFQVLYYYIRKLEMQNMEDYSSKYQELRYLSIEDLLKITKQALRIIANSDNPKLPGLNFF